MKTILISAATATQLASFASINLGLPADYREGTATLVAKIRATGYDKDSIEVEDDSGTVAPKSAVAAQPAEKDKVTVLISASEAPGGSDDVFAAVNGSGMLIPRGKPVSIPYRYYEVLKNAVSTVYDPLPNGGMSEPRQVPQYPFSVIL